MRTWDQLVYQLKRIFIVGDYQFSLRKRIEQTFQDKYEPVGSYIAKMKILFDSLYPPISESEKVLAVKRNMNIEISQKLYPFVIRNLFTLEQACFQIERNLYETGGRARMMEPKPNNVYGRGPQAHEVELSSFKMTQECSESYSDAENAQILELTPEVAAIVSNDTKPKKPCCRCKGNHAHANCGLPLPSSGIYCFVCGLNDFRASNCPTCSRKPKNSQQGSRI